VVHRVWFEITDLKPNNGRNEPRNRASSWVFALAGVAAYLLLGVLLALLLDWYINPGDPSEKRQELEAVRVKLEAPCVLGDGALDIFGSIFGLLGLYLD
jgi:hypothetical protein